MQTKANIFKQSIVAEMTIMSAITR